MCTFVYYRWKIIPLLSENKVFYATLIVPSNMNVTGTYEVPINAITHYATFPILNYILLQLNPVIGDVCRLEVGITRIHSMDSIQYLSSFGHVYPRGRLNKSHIRIKPAIVLGVFPQAVKVNV